MLWTLESEQGTMLTRKRVLLTPQIVVGGWVGGWVIGWMGG